MDGLNWDLANDGFGNFKNLKSLRDAHDTPPAMWGGVRANMNAGIAGGQRFEGLLPEWVKDHALRAYLGNPPRAPNPYLKRNPAAIERGEAVFYKARCHVCHYGETYADGKPHDLGLVDERDLRSRFITPTLREVYRTAPYLHHGQAATLEEIFTKFNPNDYHGRTNGLSKGELEDLLEFVRSRT